MAELAGNIHEKNGDLRIEGGLTKKQLSELGLSNKALAVLLSGRVNMELFGQKITESAVKGAIGAAASTFVGRSLVKLIPVVGWGMSAAVAAGVTEAIGWTIAVDLAEKSRKEYERRKNAEDAANAYSEAEYYKKAAEHNTGSGLRMLRILMMNDGWSFLYRY